MTHITTSRAGKKIKRLNSRLAVIDNRDGKRPVLPHAFILTRLSKRSRKHSQLQVIVPTGLDGESAVSNQSPYHKNRSKYCPVTEAKKHAA